MAQFPISYVSAITIGRCALVSHYTRLQGFFIPHLPRCQPDKSFCASLTDDSIAPMQVLDEMTAAAHSASDGHGDNFKPNSKELSEGKAPTQQYFLDEYAKEDWVAPWDIGKAQPSLIQAEREDLLKGEVCTISMRLHMQTIFPSLAPKGMP